MHRLQINRVTNVCTYIRTYLQYFTSVICAEFLMEGGGARGHLQIRMSISVVLTSSLYYPPQVSGLYPFSQRKVSIYCWPAFRGHAVPHSDRTSPTEHDQGAYIWCPDSTCQTFTSTHTQERTQHFAHAPRYHRTVIYCSESAGL